MTKFLKVLGVFVFAVSFYSCEAIKLSMQKKKPGKYEIFGNKAVLNGTLGKMCYENTKEMLDKNPQVSYIVLDKVTGSVNDYYSQKTCFLVKESGVQTIAKTKAQIHGGGVDLLASGSNPMVSDSAYLGVTSWSKGSKEASTLDKTDEDHEYYTKFYDSVGINQELYWYSLENATSEEIYWMPYEDVTLLGLGSVTEASKIDAFLKKKTPTVLLVALKSYESRYKILMDHNEEANAIQLKKETEDFNVGLIQAFEQEYNTTEFYYFSLNDLDKIEDKDFSCLMNARGEKLGLERDGNTVYFIADVSSTKEMNLPSLVLRYEDYQATQNYERTLSSVRVFERSLPKVVKSFNKEVVDMMDKIKLY
jgi:hypothetical protein